jgi:hypothetical protein
VDPSDLMVADWISTGMACSYAVWMILLQGFQRLTGRVERGFWNQEGSQGMQSRKRLFKDHQFTSMEFWIVQPVARRSFPNDLEPLGWRSAGSAARPRDRGDHRRLSR